MAPFLDAARKGHLDKLEKLFAAEVDIDEKGPNGSTALHAAAAKGHLNCVSFLLRHGAKVSAQDNEGATPLTRAALKGREDVVLHLLGCGAQASPGDIDAAGQHPAIVDLLKSRVTMQALVEKNGQRFLKAVPYQESLAAFCGEEDFLKTCHSAHNHYRASLLAWSTRHAIPFPLDPFLIACRAWLKFIGAAFWIFTSFVSVFQSASRAISYVYTRVAGVFTLLMDTPSSVASALALGAGTLAAGAASVRGGVERAGTSCMIPVNFAAASLLSTMEAVKGWARWLMGAGQRVLSPFQICASVLATAVRSCP
jgi:hypothetical protein